MSASVPFKQCQLCLEIVKGADLFTIDQRYRYECQECSMAVCPLCSMTAMNPCCFRCHPEEWRVNKAFCVQVTLALIDRQSAEFTRTFVQPSAAPSMRLALQEALGGLSTILAQQVDSTLSCELRKQAAEAWEQARASAENLHEHTWRAPSDLIGLTPSFVLRVPTVYTNESGATLAMHCFPVDVSRSLA